MLQSGKGINLSYWAINRAPGDNRTLLVASVNALFSANLPAAYICYGGWLSKKNPLLRKYDVYIVYVRRFYVTELLPQSI